MFNQLPKNSSHPISKPVVYLNDWISASAVCSEFGYEPHFFAYLLRANRLPKTFSVGHRLYFLKKDIDKYRFGLAGCNYLEY